MSPDRRCARTNHMWPVGIRMRVDMLLWPRMEAEFHGASSQIGRIETTKNGGLLLLDDASARKTAFSLSSG